MLYIANAGGITQTVNNPLPVSLVNTGKFEKHHSLLTYPGMAADEYARTVLSKQLQHHVIQNLLEGMNGKNVTFVEEAGSGQLCEPLLNWLRCGGFVVRDMRGTEDRLTGRERKN